MPRNQFPEGTNLRQKIATLLTYNGEPSAPLSDDDADNVDQVARTIQPAPFARHGISLDEVDLSEGVDEESGTSTLLVCRCGDVCVVVKVYFPSYSDDNYDGNVSWMTPELTFEKALAEVENETTRVVTELETQITRMRERSTKFSENLLAHRNVVLSAEAEDDEEVDA